MVADHGTYAGFLFGQKMYFVYFFPVAVVCIVVFVVIVHCYFISIWPDAITIVIIRTDVLPSYIASHDCVYE